MLRHRPRVLYGKLAFLAGLSLTMGILGCGDDTASHDTSGIPDAGLDLSLDHPTADTGARAADVPLGSAVDVADTLLAGIADVPMPDTFAIDLPVDAGDRIDLATPDGPRNADAGVPDAAAGADSPAASSDVRKLDGAPDVFVDPICTAADSDGFFSSCSSCIEPGNCDSVTVGGRTRRACGCENDGDCPCGLTCGSYAITPTIQVSGICTR